MYKIINFLLINYVDETPHVDFNTISLAPIILIICIIMIVLFLVLFGACINKGLGIKRFMIGNAVFWGVILVGNLFTIVVNEPIVIELPNEYTETIRLEENKDIIITKNEELNNIKIIIEFKVEATSFEYNYKFYNKKKELVYAESNIFYDIRANSYKTITIEKPTEILLSGGSGQFEYKGIKKNTFINELNIKGEGFAAMIFFFIPAGLIMAIAIPKLTLYENKPERKEE